MTQEAGFDKEFWTRAKLDKFADLVINKVGLETCEVVFGVPKSELEIVQESPEFKEIYGQLTYALYEESQKFQQGWDYVELQALQVVGGHLSRTKDADYALKAAAFANRAVRRTLGGNAPGGDQMIPGKLGVQIVVNMPDIVLKQMNNGGAMLTRAVKHTDICTPAQVKQILAPIDTKPIEDVLNAIDFSKS